MDDRRSEVTVQEVIAPERRQRRWHQAHDRLYGAACELFLENGYVGTSVDEIADRCRRGGCRSRVEFDEPDRAVWCELGGYRHRDHQPAGGHQVLWDCLLAAGANPRSRSAW